jgi:predicted porin
MHSAVARVDRAPGTVNTGVLLATGLLAVSARGHAAELEVYGKLNLTLQYSDEATQEEFELQNNSSRVGVRGEKQLNTALKAIYQLEWGVNLDNEAGEDHITPRNQFVGLEGAFGTLKVGRHDTALKEAQGDFDLFNDLEGDIGRALNGENRLKDYIGYTTPAIAKSFHVTVNIFPGEDPESGENGLADKTSVSVTYEADAIYVAAAYDSDIDGEDVDTARLVGGYTLGDVQLMLLYQRTDTPVGDDDGVGVSVAWTLGKYVAKLQYLTADIWRTESHSDPLDNRFESMLSLGIDRELGEDTRLFAFYTTGAIGGAGEDDTYLAIGIEHNF